MRALVFYPFYHPIEFLLRLILKRHGSDTMAQSFERRLYRPALRIGDLPVQVVDETRHTTGTRLLINTSSLISGQRVVGASAAVPGLFNPLRIGNEVLSDGGVVDNQGIESLLDYFQVTDPELNRLRDAFRQRPELRRYVRKESSDNIHGIGTQE
jgi:predicted acylesterase/phospholipase RssA